VAGAFRNWPGIGAALLGGWLLLPVAVAVAAFASVRLAVDVLSEEAIIGAGGHGFQAGTLLAALLAFLFGLVGGFVAGLLGPWYYVFSDAFLNGVIVLMGVLLAALLAGALFLLLTTASEGWIMRLQGARRMSRREEQFLIPLVTDCASRLGLTAIPGVLMDDSREINASAGARHLIINQGLLDAFDYDREAVCGVISHELIHWRNADTLNLRFISGLALPLYASYVFLMWLARPFRHPLLYFLFLLVTAPVTFTVQRIIAPLIAIGARAAEYRADQGAVAASHRVGLRRVLSQLRRTVDGTRNGWDETVLAHHPPIELRLEALEEPGRTYLLPPTDSPSDAPVGPDGHRLQPTPPTVPAPSSG
jgi:Zn-dependent protease with chaperone function